LFDTGPIISHAHPHLESLSDGPVQHPGNAIRLENSLITSIARWLGVGTDPRKRSPHKASLKDLAGIRTHLLQAIEDCLDQQALRLRKKIESARTPQELWMLRNDAFQLISQQHNQSVAAERINALIQIFEGWLEPKQLVRIK
jgi:hypothetical protein